MVNFDTLLVDDTLLVYFCYIIGELIHYWFIDTLMAVTAVPITETLGIFNAFITC